MIQLRQIAAMTGYEFRMHWRRRVMLVVALSMASICVAALLIGGLELQRVSRDVGAFSGELDIVPFFGLLIYFMMIALFTPIAAESVPVDRQFGVYELMQTLPLRREIYLIGKLAGLFVSQLAGLVAVMIVVGTAAWWVLGAFDVPAYIRMWVVAALPLALLNPGLCLLAAAGQPTRRRAALIGALVAVLCFLSFTSSVNSGIEGAAMTAWDIINPARPAILRYLMPSVTVPDDVLLAIPLTLAAGLVELVGLGAFFVMWTHWRESRV